MMDFSPCRPSFGPPLSMPHTMPHLERNAILLAASLLLISSGSAAAQPEQAQHDFFEKQVRPLLVKHCYECHSSEAEELKGGLALDSRAGWERGGDSGAAIVPGKPNESLFMEALNYESYEMPPAGKLKDTEIQVFEEWIKNGAYDPREAASAAVAAEPPSYDWEKSRQFWAFQAPVAHAVPSVIDTNWPLDDVDRFILARLEAENL